MDNGLRLREKRANPETMSKFGLSLETQAHEAEIPSNRSLP